MRGLEEKRGAVDTNAQHPTFNSQRSSGEGQKRRPLNAEVEMRGQRAVVEREMVARRCAHSLQARQVSRAEVEGSYRDIETFDVFSQLFLFAKRRPI